METHDYSSGKALSELIRQRLRAKTGEPPFSVVSERELASVWPINEEDRESKIHRFAEENGFRLDYYGHGVCTIFVEAILHVRT